MTFSADVIVGFPGETEEDFAKTAEFCRNERFLHMHIFPYSKRAGTVAAERTDTIAENVKHERLLRLEEIGREVKRELLDDYITAHTVTPVKVLVEKSENGAAIGHSEHYIEVRISNQTANAGDILDVYPISHNGDVIEGRTGND